MTGEIFRIERKVQYAAQLCEFDIKAINSGSKYQPTPNETFRNVREFAYHYENFCQRVFSYRDKLMLFLNAVIPLGFKDERDVAIKVVAIQPLIRTVGLEPTLKLFSKRGSIICETINERNVLTHRIYYGPK